MIFLKDYKDIHKFVILKFIALFKIEKINPSISLAILDLQAFRTIKKLENKREIETEGTNFLLNKLFEGRDVSLQYTPHKKPYLEGETEHVSISHSHDKLVIIVNTEQSTGVDVELIRDKIKNIKHKYLNEAELLFAGENVEILTILWAAKESIYKAYGLKEVEFNENIFIEPFKAVENNFYGRMDLPNFKKRFLMHYEKIDNYILVYILSEV